MEFLNVTWLTSRIHRVNEEIESKKDVQNVMRSRNA
jgi:hypothetical protein